MTITLYAFPVSQPARAVLWAMLAEGTKFEYVTVMPGKGTRTKEYMAQGRFPTVPRIVDGDFVLNESHAILTYLGEKEEWALYPKDPQVRAKIQEYFNWHHGNTRKVTTAYFAPIVRKDIPFPKEVIAFETLIATNSLKTLNKILAATPFITGHNPTVADISAFCEISQCLPEIFNLTPLEPYPHVKAWLARCKTDIPKYEEAHESFFKIMPRIQAAFKSSPKM
eukprot:TRINITY_DN24563_c0_g1_i1.p1 TRINITY_DN24563_c0_g1~~TRINITY_DN24563_c0_g1_i1.p1  ORF type:complete len:224 (+),score=63.00 TRINITY_DN24563_c0_g1_i1:50-721(+)